MKTANELLAYMIINANLPLEEREAMFNVLPKEERAKIKNAFQVAGKIIEANLTTKQQTTGQFQTALDLMAFIVRDETAGFETLAEAHEALPLAEKLKVKAALAKAKQIVTHEASTIANEAGEDRNFDDWERIEKHRDKLKDLENKDRWKSYHNFCILICCVLCCVLILSFSQISIYFSIKSEIYFVLLIIYSITFFSWMTFRILWKLKHNVYSLSLNFVELLFGSFFISCAVWWLVGDLFMATTYGIRFVD